MTAASLGDLEEGLFLGFPVALYRTAPDGQILYANRALVRMLGYADTPELKRVNAGDVYDDPTDRLRWKDLLEQGDEGVVEMRDRRADGCLIWVRDTARTVRDSFGMVLWYEGALENITARREADLYLTASEERFRRLASVSEDVLWEWDLRTGRVQWSHALRTVFGHRPEEVGPGIEHSYVWWKARLHAEDRERVIATFHESVRGGAVRWSSEYRFRRANGSYARVYDRCHIERDKDSQPVRVISSMVDLDRGAHQGTIERALDTIRSPLPATSDDSLIAWTAAGDERAFEELFARHSASLGAALRSRVDDEAEVEELVADTFLQAWKHAADFDPQRGSVGGWLTCIGQSRAADGRRKGIRRRRLLERTLGDPSPAPATDDGPGEANVVRATLTRLPTPQRDAIELAYLGGLSHTEVANRLAAPLGTVKTRIRAGLERMRRDLVRERP